MIPTVWYHLCTFLNKQQLYLLFIDIAACNTSKTGFRRYTTSVGRGGDVFSFSEKKKDE